MNIRNIVICASISAVLAGFGSVALAPATAEAVYTPPVLNCESWEVPGWLNDQGDPTGCVDNAPCPEAREGLPCPADVPAEPVPAEVPAPVVVAPVAPAQPAPVPVAPKPTTGCN